MTFHPQPRSLRRRRAGRSEFACKESRMEKEERERTGAANFQTEASRFGSPAHLLQTSSSRFPSTQKFVPFAEDFQKKRTFDAGGGGEEPRRIRAGA